MSQKTTKKVILFVDDEKRWTETYVQELEACGYTVHHEIDVDSSLKYFERNNEQIALLILDIMMPSGTMFTNGDTDYGMRTGVRFYERIRQKSPDLPIIILTNVSDEHDKQRFYKEKNCEFLSKPDTLPYELADEVRNIIDKTNTNK